MKSRLLTPKEQKTAISPLNVAAHYLQGYLALFQYRRKHPMYLNNEIGRSLFCQLNCIKMHLEIKISVVASIFIGLYL